MLPVVTLAGEEKGGSLIIRDRSSKTLFEKP
jgi:hypothetical protein